MSRKRDRDKREARIVWFAKEQAKAQHRIKFRKAWLALIFMTTDRQRHYV